MNSQSSNIKLALYSALLVAGTIGISTKASALEQSINISKNDVNQSILRAIGRPKIRINNYGSGRYTGKSQGNSYLKTRDAYIDMGGKRQYIPIPEFSAPVRVRNKVIRIWKVYANDINLAKFRISSNQSSKIGFYFEMEGSGPEVKVHCLRRTLDRKKKFHKRCILKGLSPDVHFNNTSLGFKVSPVIWKGSLSYSNISDVKFNTKFSIGNFCKVAKGVCRLAERHIKRFVTEKIKTEILAEVNKSSNKDKVADAIRNLINARLPKKVNWNISKLQNKSTYYRITVKSPIDKNSVVRVGLNSPKKLYVKKCPTYIPLSTTIATVDKLKGKLWLLHKGGKKSKKLDWKVNTRNLKMTTSSIKRYYRLPKVGKYKKKSTWTQLVIQWTNGKGKSFTKKSNKVFYSVRCKKPTGGLNFKK